MTILTSFNEVLTALKGIPGAVWGTIVGSLLALSGVVVSLRHARKLQATQLSHDSLERSRERQMSWKREIYLYAAESISRLNGLLGSIIDLRVEDRDLSRVYQEEIAKLNRMQVLASDKTLRAINTYLGEFAALYVQLTIDRALLVLQRNEIESLTATISGVEHGIERGGVASSEDQRKQIEQISQQRQALTDQLLNGNFDLLKRCLDAGLKLSPLVTPALISVREELELPLDSEEYIRHANEIIERLKGVISAEMEKVDRIRNS